MYGYIYRCTDNSYHTMVPQMDRYCWFLTFSGQNLIPRKKNIFNF